MSFVSDGFSPDLDGSVHHILVALDAGTEHLRLILLTTQLNQLIPLPLQLLPDRNFVFEFLAGRFEFVVDVGVADGVENSF